MGRGGHAARQFQLRLIENNRRRIGLLEQAARLLYKEWFVHLRFPGHEHVGVVAGVPAGWAQTTVPEIIDVNPRETIEKDTDILYVPMSCLSETNLSVDSSGFEIRRKATSVKFRNGDTLFARITPCLENGKTGFVNFLKEEEVATGSTEFIVLRGQRARQDGNVCKSPVLTTMQSHCRRATCLSSSMNLQRTALHRSPT